MEIDCEEMRSKAQAYLDGELTNNERDHFLKHLDMCSHCFSRLEFQRLLKKITQKTMLRLKGSEQLRTKVMKNFLFLLLLAGLACFWPKISCAADYPDPSLYSQILEEYVQDGVVQYRSLAMAPSRLDAYLDILGEVDRESFKSWDEKEQIAFLINLYNAATLRLVLDHYPIRSIKKIRAGIFGPWDQKVVRLFGKKVTLNRIEHKILRKNYEEPRIHFALVCAAKGCPPLRDEAYDPLRLDEQLEEQGKLFLRQKEKNYIDPENKVFYLSPIFKWFKKDFLKNSDSIEDYVYAYFPSKDARALRDEKVKIKYTDYDWTLNV